MIAERWPSGLRRRFAKPLYGQKLYPGFESLPLRQFFGINGLDAILKSSGDPADIHRLTAPLRYPAEPTLLLRIVVSQLLMGSLKLRMGGVVSLHSLMAATGFARPDPLLCGAIMLQSMELSDGEASREDLS